MSVIRRRQATSNVAAATYICANAAATVANATVYNAVNMCKMLSLRI